MKKSVLTLAALAATIGYAAADQDRERPQPPAPEEIAQQMLADHDENGDGALDAEELKAAHEARKEQAKERRRRKGEGKGFRKGPRPPRGDGDEDGQKRERRKRPTAEDVIEKHDTDASGSLDEAELTDMIEARREHMRERRHKRGGGRGPRGPIDQD
ncbi:hypothetical protein [Sulfuriroseicoccus oceanibius]|uniref:EF-hand domain-containing protein n=1 Tax=Sulfuriroseicoccus oceanibius TaxID=2707525 RepID=A0A6B3LCZ1_9BACT|nr:hypothetical protein [Sulfuriroseicoccus oceanibius]QQL44928.1 hypothetical protein G3M56_013840 [Sulfuriroseicoccus oceanibius]